ncbi:MAG: histone deacetylase family protein [Bacteroidales bacterium]|nr:histone deacetylase family protein [Bacteroidales bacterium]
MLRIRKISNPFLKDNRDVMTKIRDLVKRQFPGVDIEKIDAIDNQMADPVSYKFMSLLFIAEDFRGNLRGFAILLYMSDLKFCYLDFMAVNPGTYSSGVGGAIYERVRDEALSLGSSGLFFETLPDDPALCSDQTTLEQNRKRLRFYERYGARPIAGTDYETPVNKDDDCPPYLVFDGLGKTDTISAKVAKRVFKAILNRKYGDLCPPEYIKRVTRSVKDDPVRIRDYRYIKPEKVVAGSTKKPSRSAVVLVYNDRHDIHHVREVGYVESPVRVSRILQELAKTGWFRTVSQREYPDRWITKVHDRGYLNYFKKVCAGLPKGKSIYPYVFPIRNKTRPPVELSVRAGYYCIDTFTPLNNNAYLAARAAVNCALTAADSILEGHKFSYALIRPPGHHAETSTFGGFCYFNNAAIAANYLSSFGRVAILDIDYHHGNGQQEIFYGRSDVLTISIHGHPSFAYPYFSGYISEKGEGEGEGFNMNIPLQEITDGPAYLKKLTRAVARVNSYKPDYLIVALGLDTASGDPTGTWTLRGSDFENNGKLISTLKVPTVVIQEGGYNSRNIGINARMFFKGLAGK